jgi:hypothetical protein
LGGKIRIMLSIFMHPKIRKKKALHYAEGRRNAGLVTPKGITKPRLCKKRSCNIVLYNGRKQQGTMLETMSMLRQMPCSVQAG